MTEPAIRFDRVTKRWDGHEHRQDRPALRDLTLEVARGETLCLVGTSGSGKTTALKLVNRLLTPTQGRVFVDGEDVTALSGGAVVALRRKIGYVIQKAGLFPHLTVAGNVGLLPRLSGWDSPRVLSRVDELLALAGLPPAEFRDRKPSALSGGQAQRVGIARALALEPPILLMDEPFGALDPVTRRKLRDEFRALRTRLSKTILLVTHDIAEAFSLGDRVALLHEGELVQVGTPDDLRSRPRTEFARAFLEGDVPA